MSALDLPAIVKEELSNIAPDVDMHSLDSKADLREALDIDSMDFLNFITALCRRLRIEIPEIDYPKLMTLDKATAYLASKTKAK